MRTAAVLLGVAAALTLQTTLAGMLIGKTLPVNLVLVAVVFGGLAFGPVTGMLGGALGGLAQDALAGGIVGLGGLSKTMIGFVVGLLGAQFIVSQLLPRFVMFVAATVLHEILFEGLHALVDGRAFALRWPAVLTQGLVNAVIGLAAFWVLEKGPTALARRRAQRASFTRRRY